MPKSKLKVVTLGGGGGSAAVLLGLKKYFSNITAITTTADNGGSSGVLRDSLGVFSPGDARQCLVALSSQKKQALANYMNYRFTEGELKGHNAGNLLLAGLQKTTGDFVQALKVCGELLGAEGEVLPVTDKMSDLLLELNDGTIIVGENHIYQSQIISQIGVKRIFFGTEVAVGAMAKKKIKTADVIVICPGNLFVSIIPALLPKGMKELFRKSKAQVIYLVNLINQPGQTDGLRGEDYCWTIEKYIGKNRINTVIANSNLLNDNQYDYVKFDNFSEKLVLADLLGSEVNYGRGDSLAQLRSPIKHDSAKMGKVIHEVLKKQRSLID